MFWRKDQTVIEPIWGPSDREFSFRVARVNRIRRKFKIEAGLLSGWRPMSNYRWDDERRRWVHNSLPLDAEA
jgi:hypothetical protein